MAASRGDLKKLILEEDIIIDYLQEVAKIGTWEYDPITNTPSWGSITGIIHEVEPGYIPEIEEGIKFYKEGESRDRITEVFSRCVEKGVGFDEELEIVTAKGNEKWIRTIGVPIVRDGKCVKVYGLFQDIDDKVRAGEQKLLKEQQFRKTFQDAAIGMAIVGLKGNWLQVNKSLCQMLGYSEEEMLAMSFQDITHEDDLNKDVSLLHKTLSGEIDKYQMDKRYYHKDGTLVWAILAVSLIRDDEGEPLHFVSQISNISAIKEAESQVRKLLALSKEQNAKLLSFANIVSHNLRSHSSNLQLLLDIYKREHKEATENELFPMINTVVNNLNETIANLNEIVLIQRDGHKEIRPVNIFEYVEKCIVSLNTWIHQEKATILNEVDSTIMVNGVPEYIENVMFNLISNALKYRHPTREITIKIYTEILDNQVNLVVEDNGLGIDLELHKDKLFGMYKTFHKHKDARGIGLFITKNQVEAMNGAIKAESNVGKGSKFLVTLELDK